MDLEQASSFSVVSQLLEFTAKGGLALSESTVRQNLPFFKRLLAKMKSDLSEAILNAEAGVRV